MNGVADIRETETVASPERKCDSRAAHGSGHVNLVKSPITGLVIETVGPRYCGKCGEWPATNSHPLFVWLCNSCDDILYCQMNPVPLPSGSGQNNALSGRSPDL